MEDGPNMSGPGPWGPGGPPGSRNDGPDNGRPPPFGVDRCVTTFRYVGHFSKIEMSKHRYHREREREREFVKICMRAKFILLWSLRKKSLLLHL